MSLIRYHWSRSRAPSRRRFAVDTPNQDDVATSVSSISRSMRSRKATFEQSNIVTMKTVEMTEPDPKSSPIQSPRSVRTGAFERMSPVSQNHSATDKPDELKIYGDLDGPPKEHPNITTVSSSDNAATSSSSSFKPPSRLFGLGKLKRKQCAIAQLPPISPTLPQTPRPSIPSIESVEIEEKESSPSVSQIISSTVPNTSDFHGPHSTPYVGLFNQGNTCYMSVIFQSLRFTPCLAETCIKGACTENGNNICDPACSSKLISRLSVLFGHMIKRASHKDLFCDIERVRSVMGDIFCSSEQQDATEFLVCILDSLHSEIISGLSSRISSQSDDQTGERKFKPHSRVDFWNKNRFRQKFSNPFSGLTKSKGVVCSPVSVCLPENSSTHPAIIAWDAEVKRETSQIKNLFMSQLQTYRQCQTCHLEMVSYDVAWNISVPIPDPALKLTENQLKGPLSPVHPSASGGNNPDRSSPHGNPYTTGPRSPPSIHLSDCMHTFVQSELLDGEDKPYCQSCNQHTACVIQNTISRFPDILVIHLLRFQFGEESSKNNILVNFDMEFDLSEIMLSEYEVQHDVLNTNPNTSDARYRLYAVVYHEGNLTRGHYTAACRVSPPNKPDKNEWYFFDDEYVKPITPEEVVRPSAYVLFYENRSIAQRKPSTTAQPTNIGPNGVQISQV